MADDPTVVIISPSGQRIPVLQSNLDKALKVPGTKLAEPEKPAALPERQSVSATDDMVEVQSPSGRKIWVLKSNEGEALKVPGTKLVRPPMPQSEAFELGGQQGLTWGTADEMIAGGSAGLRKLVHGEPAGENYLKQHNKENDRIDQAFKEHPWTYVGGNVVGSIPWMVGTRGKSGVQNPGLLRQLLRLSPQAENPGIWRSMGHAAENAILPGMGIGAASAREGIENRVKGAITGGLISPLVAAGFTGLARGGHKLLQGAAQKVSDWFPDPPPMPGSAAAAAPVSVPPVATPHVPPSTGPIPNMAATGAQRGPLRPPLAGPPVVAPQTPRPNGLMAPGQPLRPPMAAPVPRPAPAPVQAAPVPPMAGPVGQPPLRPNPIPAPGGITSQIPGAADLPQKANLLGRIARQYPGVETPAGMAEIKMLESMGMDRLSIDRIRARVQRAHQMGNTDYTIADAMGEAGQRRTQGAMLHEGEQQSLATEKLWNRQNRARGEAVGQLERTTGVSGDAEEVALGLQRQALERAAPHYDAAFSDPKFKRIIDPEINYILNAPQMAPAYAKAQKLNLMQRKPPLPALFDENGGFNVNNPPSLETLDMMKRAIGRMINAEKRNKMVVGDPEELRVLDTDLSNLTRRLKEITGGEDGAYSKALAEYRGPKELQEALDAGLKFVKNSPGQIARDLRDKYTTHAEREHYLLGVVDHVREDLSENPAGTDVFRLVFGDDKKREQLRALFPNAEAYTNFYNKMQLLARENRTRLRTIGGSDTMKKKLSADAIAFNPADAVVDAVQGNWLGAAGKMMKINPGGVPAATAGEITDIALGNPFAGLDRLAARQRMMAQPRPSTPVPGTNAITHYAGLLSGR